MNVITLTRSDIETLQEWTAERANNAIDMAAIPTQKYRDAWQWEADKMSALNDKLQSILNGDLVQYDPR